MLIDAIGFFAFAANVAGNMLLAWKSKWGWAVRIVSIVAWGIYSLNIASWPMLANAVTFFAINCFGWWKWTKEAERKAREEHWFETQRRAA